MNAHPFPGQRRWLLRPLLAAMAGAAGAGAAWADEPSPYYIGASAAYTHTSNVFQEVNGRADSYWSTGLLAGFDQMLGRQHLYANGTAQANRYQNFDQLNNTSYGLSAGLDWATLERLTGSLRYNTNQALVNYADANLIGPVDPSIKDLQKIKQASASIRWGSTPGLAIDGGFERRSVRFSVPEDKRGYRQDVTRAGLQWGSSELLTLGIGARFTKGDYPTATITPLVLEIPPSPGLPGSPRIDATFGPDESKRRDIDFTAKWVPSGSSTVNGRISLTRETHSQPTIPEFSGVTGALSLDYKPGGRVAYKASVSRDTVSETAFADLPDGARSVRGSNDRLATALSLGAVYELTAKIALNANFKYDNAAISNVGGGDSNTATYQYAFGANWQPTRYLGVACNISQETRSSDYRALVTGCSAQITLR
jgi:Putative beta-barrel porin 2